jgi:hypothetical protein
MRLIRKSDCSPLSVIIAVTAAAVTVVIIAYLLR